MSDRTARIEAAADAIYECFAKARRTAPPAQPSYSDLALAALAAADAVQGDRVERLKQERDAAIRERDELLDASPDADVFYWKNRTLDHAAALVAERVKERQPADGKRIVDLDAVIEALDDVASKVLPGSDPMACVRAAAGVIERKFGGSAPSEEESHASGA